MESLGEDRTCTKEKYLSQLSAFPVFPPELCKSLNGLRPSGAPRW